MARTYGTDRPPEALRTLNRYHEPTALTPDEVDVTRTFNDFDRHWVQPELRRRYGEAGPPPDFRIFQCLVRLPDGMPPIVEFNNEVRWSMRCKIANGTRVAKGDPVYLYDIDQVESVRPPEYDGRAVAFVYIHRLSGAAFRMIFDFSAGLAQAEPSTQGSKWKFSDAVCEHLSAVLFERAIRFQDGQEEALASIGMWPIPSLIPHPLSQCTHLVRNGKHDEAREVLVHHCCPDWLDAQLDRWLTVPELADRRALLTQALAAHRAGNYILAIHAIVPQFEGMVSDRLSRSLPPGQMPSHQKSKLQQLREMALDGDDIAFSFRRVVESTINFFLTGPVLGEFKRWLDTPNSTFPNRHVVAHGKFFDGLYTEENSVKAFLLLDTLAEIVRMIGSGPTPSEGS